MTDNKEVLICETCGEETPIFFWGKSCVRCVVVAVKKKVVQ